MRQSTEDLSNSKRALSLGHCALLPPRVLFLAAQDEFVRAVPELKESEKVALKAMRSKPEAQLKQLKQGDFYSDLGGLRLQLLLVLHGQGHR